MDCGPAAISLIARGAADPPEIRHSRSRQDGLPSPSTLELRDENGTLIEANDNWQDNPNQAAEITATGLAPTTTSNRRSPPRCRPGSTPFLLAGLNGGTGFGLVEIYDCGAP